MEDDKTPGLRGWVGGWGEGGGRHDTTGNSFVSVRS